jgi:hypothetical protein
MPEPTRPLPPQQAPDPARVYERAKPEAESGMGRLDNNIAVPIDRPDATPDAAGNAHASRQLNSSDALDERAARTPGPDAPPPNRAMPPPEPVDHSMLEEEPDGWDMAPTDISNPRDKRHPRTEGKGGTP